MPKNLPKRSSLVFQVVQVISEMIEAGELGDYLPGEMELASQFQVGRNTVRKALKHLTTQGLVEQGYPGKRRKILVQSRAGRVASTDMIMLSPFEFDQLPPLTLRIVDEIRERLSPAGYTLKIRTSRAFHLKRPEKILQTMVDTNPAAAWILHQTTQPIQQWFQSRTIPAAILGMPHPGIQVPAVSLDMRAVARHAVGSLLAKGHEAIALIRSGAGLAGSAEIEKGYDEGLLGHGLESDHSMIYSVEARMPVVCTMLDRLIRQEKRVTGFLVESSWIVPTIMTYLASRDLTCPGDYSLIALFDSPGLENLYPDICRYTTNYHREVQRLVQLAMRSAEQGAFQREAVMIFPTFHAGNSIGAA